jgi:hypothetical protein
MNSIRAVSKKNMRAITDNTEDVPLFPKSELPRTGLTPLSFSRVRREILGVLVIFAFLGIARGGNENRTLYLGPQYYRHQNNGKTLQMLRMRGNF